MKRIISLVFVLTCIVSVFASCAKQMSAAEYYDNYGYRAEYTPALTTAAPVDELYKLNYEDHGGSIIAFTNDAEKEKTKFYNVETDKIVLEILSEKLHGYTFKTIFDHTFIFTVEKRKNDDKTINYSSNLYDANGNLISTGRADDSYYFGYVSSSADLFKFEDNIYRVNNKGEATLILSNPFFGSLPSDLIKTNEYYYYNGNKSITVYDHSLKEVLFWEVPYSSCYEARFFVLSEEKVLVQMIDMLPENETVYDYMDESGNKIALTSIIIDVATGKERKVDLDYRVISVSYSSNRIYGPKEAKKYAYSDNLDNIASIQYIKDHRLYDASPVYAALSGDNATVRLEIAPEFDNIPDEIAPGRFIYTSGSGKRYLLNEKLEVIAGADNYYYNKRNDYYLLMQDRIYDYNFDLVYDLEAEDEELVRFIGESFVVSLDDGDGEEYYICDKNGNKTQIMDYYSSNSQYYSTREVNVDGSCKYVFYNSNGAEIFSVDDADRYAYPKCVYTYDNGEGCIVCINIDENETYYKLSK